MISYCSFVISINPLYYVLPFLSTSIPLKISPYKNPSCFDCQASLVIGENSVNSGIISLLDFSSRMGYI
jgi:hypothetical protein